MEVGDLRLGSPSDTSPQVCSLSRPAIAAVRVKQVRSRAVTVACRSEQSGAPQRTSGVCGEGAEHTEVVRLDALTDRLGWASATVTRARVRGA